MIFAMLSAVTLPEADSARVSSPAVLPFQQAAVCGNLHFQASLDVQQYAVLVVLSLHVRAELPQLSL